MSMDPNELFATRLKVLLGNALQRQPTQVSNLSPFAVAPSQYTTRFYNPPVLKGTPGSGGGSSSGGTGLRTEFQQLVNQGKTTTEAAKQIQALEDARAQLQG